MTRFVMPAGSDCTCGGMLHEVLGKVAGLTMRCDKCGVVWTREGKLLVTHGAKIDKAPARPEVQYPECDKLAAVSMYSQKIGEFVDWMRDEKGYVFGKWHESGDYLDLYPHGIQDLLAEFYDIDLKKVEQERRAILEALQKKG